jgi:Mg2+ and Co2+ transporter CorA
MVGLRLYVTKQRLITSRKHHVSAVQRTADAVAAGEETAPRNPGEIVAVILLWLVYFMQEPIKQLEDEFIAMEQKTLLGEAAEPERMRKDLNQLRYRMLKFCRYMMPQKQTLEELHKIASQQSVLFSPEALETIGAAKANQSALTLRLKTMSYQAQLFQQELSALSQERQLGMMREAYRSQERLATTLTTLTSITVAAIPPGMFLASLAVDDDSLWEWLCSEDGSGGGEDELCLDGRPTRLQNLPRFLVPLVFALVIFLALKCWFGVSARGARNK